MIPSHMDREQFAERKVLGAAYLARIARATGEKRQELLVEWAEKLYDAVELTRDPWLTKRARLGGENERLAPPEHP